MNRYTVLITAGLLTTACAGTPVPAIAADQPNIMVIGSEEDPDVFPRRHRVYTRVVNALVDQMHVAGFKVFDTGHVTAGKFTLDANRKLTDAVVLDVVRSVQTPPIDVAVLFQIYPKSKKLQYTMKLGARIEGRLLNVHSGRRLGNFEVATPQPIPVSLDCKTECLWEKIGDEAKILAQHLGAVLVAKLEGLTVENMKVQSTATSIGKGGLLEQHVLVFNNFTDDEINEIELLIVAFSGYEHHRPIRCQARHCEYWYESRSDRARLKRNLIGALDYLDIKGTVTFDGNNKFLVEKIGIPK